MQPARLRKRSWGRARMAASVKLLEGSRLPLRSKLVSFRNRLKCSGTAFRSLCDRLRDSRPAAPVTPRLENSRGSK